MRIRPERGWTSDLDAGALEALTRLDEAISDSLGPYLGRLDHLTSRKGKAIHDLVWGFVELSAGELAIVDSPLMQRLRFVRQLGLAHLLFPAAAYSRFEHSLGTCFAMGKILDSLRVHAFEDGVEAPPPEAYRLLRYAALLHDVGHLAFSHAIERCWESMGDRGQSLLKWGTAIGRALEPKAGEPLPAEALAVAIISTPSMVRLVEKSLALDCVEVKGDASHAVCEIANVIVGADCTSSLASLSALLSGPMDADKMDYLARDSFVTGVNLTGDLRRLITKMRLTYVDRNGVGKLRVSLSQSGEEALQDLMMSREILTQRIYRHPKVLAAEGLLEQVLETAAELYLPGLNPHELLWVGDDVLLDRLAHSSRTEGDASARLSALTQRILDRDLPKRALVARPSDQPNPSQRARLSTLCKELRDPFRRAEFRSLIESERGPDAEISIVGVVTAADRDQTLESDTSALHVLHSRKHEALYVFSDARFTSETFAATRRILSTRYGIYISELAARRAKVDEESPAAIDPPRFASGQS